MLIPVAEVCCCAVELAFRLEREQRRKLQRFDEDCDKIVRGLAMLDANDEMLSALRALEALPINTSWSPAEIAARDLARGVIAKVERRISR